MMSSEVEDWIIDLTNQSIDWYPSFEHRNSLEALNSQQVNQISWSADSRSADQQTANQLIETDGPAHFLQETKTIDLPSIMIH